MWWNAIRLLGCNVFTPFYHGLIRKYTTSFGTLFSQTILTRNEYADNTGNESQRFTVPIEYSARDSWLARLRKDPNLNVKNGITLPRYAFEMTGMRYDPSRKLNSLNQRTVPIRSAGNTSLRRYFIPTPYVLTFSLYAITRSIEDANQITEQIAPYFAPDYTLLVKLLPSVNILDRMRVVMDGGSPQWADNYETVNFDTTREIVLTYTFNAHTNFYGPVAATPANVIRKVIVDLYDSASGDLTDPIRIDADGFNNLQAEDGFFLLDETSTSDVGRLDTRARIEVVPDPLDAPAERPVNTTSTITEYESGDVVSVQTFNDVLE